MCTQKLCQLQGNQQDVNSQPHSDYFLLSNVQIMAQFQLCGIKLTKGECTVSKLTSVHSLW
jgi:hypothetical protein